MQKMIVIQPRPRAWLEGSILQPYVSQYGEHLQRRRYAPGTQRAYMCCIAHFAHWLTQEGYRLEAIGQVAVIRFLSEHLPACVCPDPVRRIRHDLQAALGHLGQASPFNECFDNRAPCGRGSNAAILALLLRALGNCRKVRPDRGRSERPQILVHICDTILQSLIAGIILVEPFQPSAVVTADVVENLWPAT